MQDFQDVLTASLAQISTLRDNAKKVVDGFTPEDPQWDAADLIWRDLDRAYDDLSRTQYAISEGYV